MCSWIVGFRYVYFHGWIIEKYGSPHRLKVLGPSPLYPTYGTLIFLLSNSRLINNSLVTIILYLKEFGTFIIRRGKERAYLVRLATALIQRLRKEKR